MAKVKQNNFGRFYCLIKGRPEIDKELMVHQFTDGRTTHLREMYREEYEEMCDAIEGKQRETSSTVQLKRWRSSALLRLQRLGIHTADNWDGIDSFCMSSKIAGKRFASLSVDELKSLVRKLENILRKGGLKAAGITKAAEKGTVPETRTIYIPMPVPGNTKYMS